MYPDRPVQGISPCEIHAVANSQKEIRTTKPETGSKFKVENETQ
jgi:hypothetical protein